MAARGSIAKQEVIQKLKDAFGDNFIGEYEKKVYLWANDGGEQVQIALTLTCPKMQVETATVPTPERGQRAEIAQDNVEVTPEEIQNLEDLMARLNL